MYSGDVFRCKRCALPATFPGISFDQSQICNYCSTYELLQPREARLKSELTELFRRTIDEHRGSHDRYDAVLMFSGGKDSTYLLQLLTQDLGLRVLAHTLDNGFIAAGTWENIDRVLPQLGVDHEVTRPPVQLMERVFRSLLDDNPFPPELLAMASPICHACIGMVIGSTLNIAVERKIPLVFSGMTPGQYPSV